MKFNDAVFGLLLVLLGTAVLAVVKGYPNIPGQQVGPALFPGIIASGLCLSGLALMVQGWRERVTTPWMTAQDWIRSPRHVASLVVLLGSIVFYLLASEKLGFVLCSILILAANFYMLKVPPARAVLIAVIATLVIHFAFYKLLRVPLPWGVLVNHAW